MAIVSDLHRNRKRKKQTDTLENNDIDYLIRKYPVTCTLYYRQRINALIQLICHDETFFRKISDYFFVTEFQNRGNEHDQALLWIEGTSVYGNDNNSDIEQFVDKYITWIQNLRKSIDITIQEVVENKKTRIADTTFSCRQ